MLALRAFSRNMSILHLSPIFLPPASAPIHHTLYTAWDCQRSSCNILKPFQSAASHITPQLQLMIPTIRLHNLCSILVKKKKKKRKIHFYSILSTTCANITSSILELAPEINSKLTWWMSNLKNSLLPGSWFCCQFSFKLQLWVWHCYQNFIFLNVISLSKTEAKNDVMCASTLAHICSGSLKIKKKIFLPKTRAGHIGKRFL